MPTVVVGVPDPFSARSLCKCLEPNYRGSHAALQQKWAGLTMDAHAPPSTMRSRGCELVP